MLINYFNNNIFKRLSSYIGLDFSTQVIELFLRFSIIPIIISTLGGKFYTDWYLAYANCSLLLILNTGLSDALAIDLQKSQNLENNKSNSLGNTFRKISYSSLNYLLFAIILFFLSFFFRDKNLLSKLMFYSSVINIGYFLQILYSPYIFYLKATGYNQYNLLFPLVKYGIQVSSILLFVQSSLKSIYILPFSYLISEIIIFIFVLFRYSKIDVGILKFSFINDIISSIRLKDFGFFIKCYERQYLKKFKKSYYFISLYLGNYLRNYIPLNFIVLTTSENNSLLFTLGLQVANILSRVEGSISGGLSYDFNRLSFHKENYNKLVSLLKKSIFLNSFFSIICLLIIKYVIKFELIISLLSNKNAIVDRNLEFFILPLILITLELSNMTYENAFRALNIFKKLANFKLMVIIISFFISYLLYLNGISNFNIILTFSLLSSLIVLSANILETYSISIDKRNILLILFLSFLPLLIFI